MTIGDSMFERLCEALRLTASRVAEAPELMEARPDFEVAGSDGTVFFAEVKTITPNPLEVKMIARSRRGEAVAIGGMPGDRMRSLIGKANRQLKAVADGSIPGVLVVFNPAFYLRWHTDPYCILTAMRGLDVIDVHVRRDSHEPPQFGELRSGPKKTMTPAANTSTAAVVCPVEIERDLWQVDVFHNAHARVRLSITAIQHEAVRHWMITRDDREWTPWSS